MSFSLSLLRSISCVLVLAVPTTFLAQDAVKPLTELNPKLRAELQQSEANTTKITLLERDGMRVRGIVTSINDDSVSISVKYGTPVIRVPFEQIDKLDHPPLTHRSKVWLSVLIGVSIAAIVVLVIYGTRTIAND